jgi:hypothetical protein
MSEVTRLGEAQRLRRVVQEVIEAVSGRDVASHDELRNILGRAYLADIFDCQGQLPCLVRVLQPLARRGLKRAVLGDYKADGEVFAFRFRVLDLASAAVVDESAFTIAARDVEDLTAWRAGLEPLFQDTGSIRLVTNVPSFACTLDAKPCELTGADLVKNVSEGEHVVALKADGYLEAVGAVRVVRKQEVRAVLPLAERPMQAPATGSAVVVPTEAVPGERVQWFGLIRMSGSVDDSDQGVALDYTVAPRGGAPSNYHVAVTPALTYLGVTAPAASSEGWDVGGTIIVGLDEELNVKLFNAELDLVHAARGTKISAGFMLESVLSTLSPTSWTLPLGWGNLNTDLFGLRLTQPFGPVLGEVAVGVTGMPHTSASLPLLLGRLAYVGEDVTANLLGNELPLSIGVSGFVGRVRAGPAEAEGLPEDAAAPVDEELPSWCGSFEALLPVGPIVVSGEAFIGEGLAPVYGAIFQGPRVRTSDGKHRLPRSSGGWAQIYLNLGDTWSTGVFAGTERVSRGLGFGVDPAGGYAIRQNSAASFLLNFRPTEPVHAGLQATWMQTDYADPDEVATLVGIALSTQYRF